MPRKETRRRSARKGELERIASRRLEALRLRKLGYSFHQIAAELKCSVGLAHSDVCASLAALNGLEEKEAEDLRRLDLERIDLVLQGHLGAALSGDDKSAGVVLRALERRAKLLGLDAPEKKHHDLGPGLTEYLAAKYGFGVDADTGAPESATRH